LPRSCGLLRCETRAVDRPPRLVRDGRISCWLTTRLEHEPDERRERRRRAPSWVRLYDAPAGRTHLTCASGSFWTEAGLSICPDRTPVRVPSDYPLLGHRSAARRVPDREAARRPVLGSFRARPPARSRAISVCSNWALEHTRAKHRPLYNRERQLTTPQRQRNGGLDVISHVPL
jgi:hypothetical protein